MKVKVASVVLAVLVATAVLGTASAGAGGFHETRLTIHLGSSPGSFTGLVKSDEKDCLQRNVTLYKVRNNRKPKKLGTDFSSASGRWRINTSSTSGVWFARVQRASYESGVTCGADRSKKISAG